MHKFRIMLYLFIISWILIACANQNSDLPPQSIHQTDPQKTKTPSSQIDEPILADTFFYGCAYLDVNQNEVVDEDDLKIEGAVFEISLGFGGITSKSGCATVVIPGGINENQWPIKAKMQLPEDRKYRLIGSKEILLAYPDTRADFLYTE